MPSGHLLWQKVMVTLQQQIDSFPGVAGVAVRDLIGALTLQINGDHLFPTASTIKIHVLTQLLLRAEQGEVDLDERITMPPPEPVFGSGVLAYLDGPLELSLRDVATLMIIASDNTATNLCIDRAGIEGTNQLLSQLGLKETRLRRKMMDHIAAVREQENISTPIELVQMLALLYQGNPTPTVAKQCLEILEKPNLGFLERGLPEGTRIANKPGWVESARCDAGIVYLPRRPYAIAIMTKYADCSQVVHEDFLAQISRTVYDAISMLDRSNRYGRRVY